MGWRREWCDGMEACLALLVENLIPEAVRLRSLNCGKRRHTTTRRCQMTVMQD